MASEYGMVVVKGVTKKLDYLLMADPDSLSGKAKKSAELWDENPREISILAADGS